MTAVNALIDWAAAHQPMLSGLAVLSMITFIGTLVAIPVLVIHIPEDHERLAVRIPDGCLSDRFLCLISKPT